MRSILTGLFISTLLLSALAGCDRSSDANTAPAHLSEHRELLVSPLIQVPQAQRVHIALGSSGAVLYSSETDDGQDVAVVVPASGIPQATGLSSANILAALGDTSGGSGTIQSLVLGARNRIWFYFLGGKGKHIRATVGRYNLLNERIELLITTDTLESASQMGDALSLARGTLLPSDKEMRLLLRHSDAWAVLHIAQSAEMNSNQVDSADQKLMLDGQPVSLNDDRYAVSPGPNNSLLILDRKIGELLTADSSGAAKSLYSFIGYPKELSAAVVLKKQVALFAADSELLEGAADPLRPAAAPLSYPALLLLDSTTLSSIPRDDIRFSGGLSSATLRLEELIPDGDNLVAYDSSSGQIIRMTFVNKD